MQCLYVAGTTIQLSVCLGEVSISRGLAPKRPD